MGRSKCGTRVGRQLPLALFGAIIGAVGFGAAGAQAADPAAPKSIWEQETLTGDWGGARTALSNKGIDITLDYTNEIFAVLSGGVRREATYEGQVHFSVNTDLEKLIGWSGAKTHVTVFQIHSTGRNAADNAGSIADPSNIDAVQTTRLYTAWFEQNAFNDRFSLRLGQIVADGEFFTSDTAGGLINGTFGWPAIFASNMISGGPAYPLATPGARVAVKPTDQITLLAGVFSGDPAGRDCYDIAQKCNLYGTTFSFSGGSLWMGEVQYALNQDKKATGLASAYKLGVWYATAGFPSQRYGTDATGALVSLGVDDTADPIMLRSDWGLYGVADQMIWRGLTSSVSLFARGSVSPTQRNLISYSADGGIGIKGPIAGRADDTLTFGVAYNKISPEVTGVDRDALAFHGPPYALRRSETVFEVSYSAQIAPWWSIQPDLQYIVRPNGGQNAEDPTLTNTHAFVAGLRSTIKF